MPTATVRIPEEKRDILKVIAGIEKRDIGKILTDLIDEYIERHKETLDLLSKPEWVEIIKQGKEEVSKGIKGRGLHEI
jgi:predicted CopG family antitoxin